MLSCLSRWVLTTIFSCLSSSRVFSIKRNEFNFHHWLCSKYNCNLNFFRRKNNLCLSFNLSYMSKSWWRRKSFCMRFWSKHLHERLYDFRQLVMKSLLSGFIEKFFKLPGTWIHPSSELRPDCITFSKICIISTILCHIV